ncbi:hypothetical protein AZI85_15220 [Bdellovibrio bacteriovorus]|uniref:Tyr recombinase domain-containing protein n=1 Tax=Bdellovibrio bacteriovorus TaxID=959 RepID=A0A150WUD6_BDEBC|nr:tyrosine-type recombinase/integrase [Bdellovibrio bacteriovorus]KYG70041.1 hypothetical protein AZI85_15220 [Bdellovibrio bacteriovorus]
MVVETEKTPRKQKPWAITKEKFLSASEYGKLRAHVRRRKSRYAILLKLFMFTAARANEGLAVRLKDLDADHKTVLIYGLKGSNDREIPLPPWYFFELYSYAKKACKSPEDRIFPFCYTILNRIWRLYRPVKKRFHALRHTLAIRVFESTRDIKLVQILLGHRSIKNTMVYLDYVYSRKEMRRILKVKY